jgi:signal transduction histidine kinase
MVSERQAQATGDAEGTAGTPQQAQQFSPELLSIISHELRSPLAAIKGYATSLRRHDQRLTRAERKEFLDAIDDASDRLTLIIERILALSQLEMGLVVLVREPVAYARLVREAIAAAERRMLASHDVERRFIFTLRDETTPVRGEAGLVLADMRYLRDLVDNLLENATRYSPNGGAIEVRLSPAPARIAQDALRPAIELTISDQGVGIPGEHLDRIFGAFQRVDIGSTRETAGLGLGLAICSKIVNLHDGVMWVESTEGAGSAFHVVLPAVADPHDP